jgi:glucan phosphoethanolaminetransferase (alkaline phosphatase superfamily)
MYAWFIQFEISSIIGAMVINNKIENGTYCQEDGNSKPVRFLGIVMLGLIFLSPHFYRAMHNDAYVEFAECLWIAGIYLLPFLFLKPRAALILLSILAISYAAELCNLYITHSYITAGTIDISLFLASNGETREYFPLFIPVIIAIVLLIAVYFIGITILKLPAVLSRRTRINLLLIILFCFAVLELQSFYSLSVPNDKYIPGKGTLTKFLEEPPLNFFYQFALAIDIKLEEKYRPKSYRMQDFKAFKKDSLPQKETYVLIIGESIRYDNLGMNGYERSTTPLLSAMPDLVNFTDYYAVSNVTNLVVPMMLTRDTTHAYASWIREKSIFAAYREAGFKTYWLSNQGPFIMNYPSFLSDIDVMKELPSSDFMDEALLPLLDSVINDGNQKQFIVIQMKGAHFRFNYRYPKAYEQFKPGLADLKFLSLNKKKSQYFINSYDNAILYNDFVVSGIIGKIRSQQGIGSALFCSDHGESLFDEYTANFGHGFEIPLYHQVHAPLFIWTSVTYASIFPEKMEQLKRNRDKCLSTGNILYTLLDMSNIGYAGENAANSIASKRFHENKPRQMITPNYRVFRFERITK